MVKFSRWRASADRWYFYAMLFYSFIAYSGNLAFDQFHLRPTDDAAYQSVSSFFGPGAYLAWWFTASSVLMKCPVEKPAAGFIGSDQNSSSQDSPDQNALSQSAPGQDSGLEYGWDLISTTCWVAIVAIWSIYRIFHPNHAELAAGLVMLEAGADFCIFHILTMKTTTLTRIVALFLFVYSIQIHQAFISPNHPLGGIVNVCVALLLTWVWNFSDWPLKLQPRRLLTVFMLVVLWFFHLLDFGTYAIMPRTEVEFISLDQLAPFIGAILAIIWSWRAELETCCGELIRFLRKSFGQLGQTLKALNPIPDRFR